jgi:hypothetical protein
LSESIGVAEGAALVFGVVREQRFYRLELAFQRRPVGPRPELLDIGDGNNASVSILPPSPFCTCRTGPGALGRRPDGSSVICLPSICDGPEDTETALPSSTFVQPARRMAMIAAAAAAFRSLVIDTPCPDQLLLRIGQLGQNDVGASEVSLGVGERTLYAFFVLFPDRCRCLRLSLRSSSPTCRCCRRPAESPPTGRDPAPKPCAVARCWRRVAGHTVPSARYVF